MPAACARRANARRRAPHPRKVRSVAGLIRRRGTIVEWQHAIPATGDFLDKDSRAPRLTAGGPRIPTGPTGEWYTRPYRVRVYYSRKTSAAFAEMFGMLDERDAQLDLAVPFAPEPNNGIVTPDHIDLQAWNSGRFTQFPINDMPQEDLTAIARDRFTIGGVRYVVKSASVSIQDNNAVVAWRLLVGATTF
jgi:hypothetical protein